MSLFLLALERGDRPLIEQALERLRVKLEHLQRDQPAAAMVGASHRDLTCCPTFGRVRVSTNACHCSAGRRRCGRLAAACANCSSPAATPDKGGDRPLALTDRRRGPRRRPVRRPRRLAADERRQDPHRRAMHPPMPCRRQAGSSSSHRCEPSRRRPKQPYNGPSARSARPISALYGSIGVSGFDEDAIRERHIVVATPEKLDFALRNDPSLLDDVGLLVFDEGHMIGLNEREVRYEVQIQRLLRRVRTPPNGGSFASRRSCPMATSSTISPLGSAATSPAACQERLATDAAALWRSGVERPARAAESARRRGTPVGSTLPHRRCAAPGSAETPYEPAFSPTILRELCLATAWRLVEDGQTVLVFCPVARRSNLSPIVSRPARARCTASLLRGRPYGPEHRDHAR